MIRLASQTGWEETTLASVIELVGGGTPRTTVSEYWDGKIPWLSVVDFNEDRRWVDRTEKSITELGLKNSSTKLLDKGDLILSARGTVGALAQLKRPMAFNQSCYGIKATEKSDINFLYYLLKFSLRKIEKNVHGSVFDTITRSTFNQIDISLPPLNEQGSIVAVLSSLDDKIELLRKQNQTLEALAQGLFKEWFVDFNFPNEQGKPYKKSGGKIVESETGEIPEQWQIKSLSDIADFLNGIALQKFPPENEKEYLPVIKIRELKAGISEQTDKASINIDKKYIIKNGDILFSWSGSLELVVWCNGKGALNQHLFKVTSENYPRWFFFYWILHHLQGFRQIASAKATTMGHIQRHHLSDALVLVPDANALQKLNDIMSPIFQKTIYNNFQIQTLSTLRDALLPRLMRGEIQVKNII